MESRFARFLDNVRRYPGYLDPYRVLVLSYEFIKPEYPDIHNALAQWVQDGGALIYVGDDSGPSHGSRSWWNNDHKDNLFGPKYNSPREHLFEQLGLKEKADGIHQAGKGVVCWLDQHPTDLTLSKAGADQLRHAVQATLEALHGAERPLNSKHYFKLKRGPYLIASVLEESITDEPLNISGPIVNLFDSKLSVLDQVTLSPGQQALLYDVEAGRPSDGKVSVIAASSRIEELAQTESGFRFIARGPSNLQASARLYCPIEPISVQYVIQDQVLTAGWVWDPQSLTVLLQYEHGGANHAEIQVDWKPAKFIPVPATD